MGVIADGFAGAFRDYATAGVPASGVNDPAKSEIRALGLLIDRAVGAAVSGLRYYATKAALDADTTRPPGTLAYVYDDATIANNTVYHYEVGGWVVDDAYFEGVASVVQPLVDEAEAAASQASDLATGLPLTYSAPNLWPDPNLSSLGWSGSVSQGSSQDGRRTLTVTGSDAFYRFSPSVFGGAGANFSVGLDIERAIFSGGGPVVILVRQVRANGTQIGSRDTLLFLEGNTTPTSGRRLARAPGMVVDAEAASIDLYIAASGAAANTITISNPLVAIGSNAGYRPVVPRAESGSGGANYYVDGRTGSNVAADSNSGMSEDAPFRTLGAAMAAVGTAADKTVAVRRGSVFRKQSMTPAGPGLKIVAYGPASDPKPQSLGSDSYRAAQFTAAGDGSYTLPLAYKPSTAALVSPTGTVTKLYNPDANTTPPAAGDWAQGSGTFVFRPPAGLSDLTGYTVEIPTDTGPGYGFDAGAANQSVHNMVFAHWRDHGASTGRANTAWHNVWCNYCGFDGFDQVYGGDNFLIRGGGAIGNGRRYGSDAGPGDGSSAHDKASGVIEFATFSGNTQTGVGNLFDTRVEVRYCSFDDNNVDLQVYAHGGGGAAPSGFVPAHTWHHNLHVHKVKGVAFAVNAGQASITTKLHNSTVYMANAVFAVGTFTGTQVDLANVIVYAPAATYVFANYVATDGSQGKVTSRNNILNAPGGAWQTGGFDATRGGGSETALLTGNPLLVDPANGDLSLQGGSPAVNSGVSLGYARDYAGNPVPSSGVDRGAIERL